jgi:hypothetical protein
MPTPNDHIRHQRRLKSLRDKAERADAALKRVEAALADPKTDSMTREIYQARLSQFRRNAEETEHAYMEVKVKHGVQ